MLYQAELHSDRAGWPSVKAFLMQGSYSDGRSIFSRGRVRGPLPVARRDLLRKTGVVFGAKRLLRIATEDGKDSDGVKPILALVPTSAGLMS